MVAVSEKKIMLQKNVLDLITITVMIMLLRWFKYFYVVIKIAMMNSNLKPCMCYYFINNSLIKICVLV